MTALAGHMMVDGTAQADQIGPAAAVVLCIDWAALESVVSFVLLVDTDAVLAAPRIAEVARPADHIDVEAMEVLV